MFKVDPQRFPHILSYLVLGYPQVLSNPVFHEGGFASDKLDPIHKHLPFQRGSVGAEESRHEPTSDCDTTCCIAGVSEAKSTPPLMASCRAIGNERFLATLGQQGPSPKRFRITYLVAVVGPGVGLVLVFFTGAPEPACRAITHKVQLCHVLPWRRPRRALHQNVPRCPFRSLPNSLPRLERNATARVRLGGVQSHPPRVKRWYRHRTKVWIGW